MALTNKQQQSILDRIMDINSNEIRFKLLDTMNQIYQMITDRKGMPIDLKVTQILDIFFPYMQGRLEDPKKRDAYARVILNYAHAILVKLINEKARLYRQSSDEFTISDSFFCERIQNLVCLIIDQPDMRLWSPKFHGRLITLVHDILGLSSLIKHDLNHSKYQIICEKFDGLRDELLAHAETGAIPYNRDNLVLSLIEIRFLMDSFRKDLLIHKEMVFTS